MALNHRHVYEGGTFVTNMGNQLRKRTEEAIKKAGMEKVLKICDDARCGEEQQTRLPQCFSLHFTGPRSKFDLSDFWDIYGATKGEEQ